MSGLRAGARPLLKCVLGLPSGVHEVSRLTARWAQQAELLETGRTLHGTEPGGEPLFQLGAGALGYLDGVDLHDGHGASLCGTHRADPMAAGATDLRWRRAVASGLRGSPAI